LDCLHIRTQPTPPGCAAVWCGSCCVSPASPIAAAAVSNQSRRAFLLRRHPAVGRREQQVIGRFVGQVRGEAVDEEGSTREMSPQLSDTQRTQEKSQDPLPWRLGGSWRFVARLGQSKAW
jgi:hypothetical protein